MDLFPLQLMAAMAHGVSLVTAQHLAGVVYGTESANVIVLNPGLVV